MVLCQVAVAALTGRLIGRTLSFDHKLYIIFCTWASVNFLLHNKLPQKLVSWNNNLNKLFCKSAIWTGAQLGGSSGLAGFVHLSVFSCQVGWVLAGLEWPQLGWIISVPRGFSSYIRLTLDCSTWQLGRVARIWVAVSRSESEARISHSVTFAVSCWPKQGVKSSPDSGVRKLSPSLGGKTHIQGEGNGGLFLQFTFYSILEIKWVWQ